MKTRLWGALLAAGVGAVALSMAGTSQGQDGKTVDVQAGPVHVRVERGNDRDERNRDTTNPANNVAYRSSKIVGMTVKDAAGQELGSIYDLVIDVESGKVRYAALSFGGLLGVGDKLFAIPWDTLECRPSADGGHELILNIDPQVLKTAPGFDQDKWPAFADGQWAQEIDTYYSKYRRGQGKQSGARDRRDTQARERDSAVR